jgi:antitoxin HicB
MFALRYPAAFSRDREGRILVRFPDLPRLATDGKDMAEAMLAAIDCLGSDLSIRMQQKEEIPPPSAPKRGQRLVPVPLWLAPSLALYVAMREQGISKSELARRLGCRETVIRRMLDPEHNTKPEKLQAALEALGKRIAITVEDAA